MDESILEGLKVAMSKGETLQQAMESFYNAGYGKEEIEEAAKALQYQIHQEQIQKPKLVKPLDKNINPVKTSGQKLQTPKATQKISNYEQEKNPRKKMIVLVGILLVAVLAILAGIFFFRENLLEFFKSILSR